LKKIIGLVASALVILGLSGCGSQDGLNRDFASEQDLITALANEGFECPIFDEFVASEFGEAGIEQAERQTGLFGWKSRSWCYPSSGSGEVSISIFENSSGAGDAVTSTNYTCKGSAMSGQFIQVRNWLLSSEDSGVMAELADLANTQVRIYPDC
jgi:hypothetical protein